MEAGAAPLFPPGLAACPECRSEGEGRIPAALVLPGWELSAVQQEGGKPVV